MPTQKRRLNITVGDDLYELLHRLSELGNQSMSAIVLELIETAQPILSQMLEAAERYRDLDADKQRALLEHFEAEGERITARGDELMAGVHEIQRDTLDAFKRVADAE